MKVGDRIHAVIDGDSVLPMPSLHELARHLSGVQGEIIDRAQRVELEVVGVYPARDTIPCAPPPPPSGPWCSHDFDDQEEVTHG